ncbi:zinc transporter ZIP1-like isoform X1 [Plodia interpunctella]|uniref:zinc transporter ZIP1-like isoform X1 n=1 Tax=Plodia interpunctella TaxID=58824 RepID=UPI002367AB1F|nr:zinc transporter ZIP1-like isoform X1 [Plodia interpunctella]
MDAVQGDALAAKIITMCCLFGISMIVGCLPLLISLKFDWFTKSADPNLRSSNQLVMGLLSFGGGVLFSTTFMHLLPEVDENIHLLQDAGDLPDMPFYFAGLIMCGGFFMMYLIEELVHVYINSRQKKVAETDVPRPFSLRREFEESSSEEHVIDVKTPGHGHSHMMDDGDDSVMSALRGLLIVLALSIHELFEGLAVGLEASVGNVWYMFGAVSAHKYIIAFCIGVELLAAGTRRWLSLVYIFTFSFMSALGIGVGILMVGGAGAADAGIYSVVLQGLACGTLIYVVFFEVWRRNNSGLMQFTCAFLGFSVMVALGLGVELAI